MNITKILEKHFNAWKERKLRVLGNIGSRYNQTNRD